MDEGNAFGTISIVGVGLLGGSIGKALLTRRVVNRVIGAGRSEDRLNVALELGAITEYSASLTEAVHDADVVILCTPVTQIISDIPVVLRACKTSAVVTDVGSVKAAICAAAGKDRRFVGSHPLAGSEQAGVAAARAELFQEATWAITPTEDTDPFAVETVRRLAQCLGAATIVLTPERHDRAVATTSHLPHAIATSLMRIANAQNEVDPNVQKLTAGSFADATRVAASSPTLWAEIFHLNRRELIECLGVYRDEISGFLDELERDKTDLLYERFRSGSTAKRSWTEQK